MSDNKDADKKVDVEIVKQELNQLIMESGTIAFDIKYLEAKQIQVHQGILERKQKLMNAPKLEAVPTIPDTAAPSVDASSDQKLPA